MLFTTSGCESECPTTKSAPIEFVTIEHHCDGKTDNIHNRLTADEENPPKSYTSPVIHPPKCPKISLFVIITILLLSNNWSTNWSTVKFKLTKSIYVVNLNFTESVQKLLHRKVKVDKIYRSCQLELY